MQGAINSACVYVRDQLFNTLFAVSNHVERLIANWISTNCLVQSNV